VYEHKIEEIDKVFQLVVDIHNQTDLTKLPNDGEIKDEYEENEVPDSSSYEEVKKIRNYKKLELFKDNFEGTAPTGIDNDDLQK